VASESRPAVFHGDDVVLLIGKREHCIVRVEDISLLEAYRSHTLVHIAGGKLLIKRPLGDCERKLESPIFFRANKSCVVNITHVKQPRLLAHRRLVFLLKDGKEVVFSRRKSALFEKTRRF
jgi:two-component system, LytTR family, response regulator